MGHKKYYGYKPTYERYSVALMKRVNRFIAYTSLEHY